MTTPARPLTARYRPVHGLPITDVAEMQKLAAALSANAAPRTFLRHLQTNDGAIIVRDRETGAIGGFTPIRKIPLWDGQRQVLGVFSGETILDPTCGGEHALRDAFTRHLLHLWLTARGVPLYWLLLANNHQTHRLLADTFDDHQPRPEEETDPLLRPLLRQCTDTLVPERREQEERGPDWRIEDQRPCIAEISRSLLSPYLSKERQKIQARRKTGEPSPPRIASLIIVDSPPRN